MRRGAIAVACALAGAAGAGAQTGVSRIRLATEAAEARLRPLESLVVQVRAYGEIPTGDGGTRTVRLMRAGARLEASRRAEPGEGEFRLEVEGEAGWVSKPFRFQGRDEESFYPESESRLASILRTINQGYLLQDAFLYTAPEQPGTYELRGELEGRTATLAVEVDPEAPPGRRPERVAFAASEPDPDPYRRLAERWAPVLAQETWYEPKADYPARFDYDGNWRGDDNWDALAEGSSQAWVYWAAMETPTHWFLIYNVFHPRDYSDRCVAGTCHENDNEGLILTVRRDGSEFGRLQAMETLAHNSVYSFVHDERIGGGVHDVDGRVELYWDGRPVVFIESGGHGIYGTASEHSRYRVATDEFLSGTGVTFLYKGVAERPRHPNDREVGYELLSIREHWWKRAQAAGGPGEATFEDFFVYRPYGNRPGTPQASLAGAFVGRKESASKAKPFWGWHDSRTLDAGVLARGQWGLDPAYAVWRNLRFPAGEAFRLDYTYNPYLGIEGK